MVVVVVVVAAADMRSVLVGTFEGLPAPDFVRSAERDVEEPRRARHKNSTSLRCLAPLAATAVTVTTGVAAVAGRSG